MQLKPEALNALKLPVKVKAGFLGSVKLKVGRVSVSQVQCISFFEVSSDMTGLYFHDFFYGKVAFLVDFSYIF
jgi:hypothetical protein